MQEINELKNLVIQSLEGNGVLGQIRAQIRASVFKIIEMQETTAKKNSGFFWENPLCQTIYDNKEGQLALELINDFLEFFKMDYTHSVFTHESNLKDASKRDDLQRKFGLKSENNRPVLFQLISALTSQASTDKENQSNPSITSTKPNTATSSAAPKTFGSTAQDSGANKTSFDNFGRGSKGGFANLDESQEEKVDLGRAGGNQGRIPPLNSFSPQGNPPAQGKQQGELSAQEAKRQAIEDLKKPIGEFNKQGYFGGYNKQQQQQREEEEEEQEEEEEENYDDEVFENVEEELVEDLEEDEGTGRDKKNMYNSSEDIIGASQSQGFDVSVDSLALEDYDYFENAERERR